MVADSNHVRRPALPQAGGTRRRLILATAGAVLSLLVVGAAALPGPALALETGAPPPASAVLAPRSVSIAVAPVSLRPLLAGEDLAVTVTITNGTDDPLAPGTIDLYLAERALTSRSALNTWLRPDKAGNPGDLMTSQAMTAPVPPDSTEIVTVTVPADSVGLTSGNAWGARGIAATLTNQGDLLAQGRSTFVWSSNEEITPVNLAVIMPITVPAHATGLIPPDSLATFTGPTGVLTRQLEGVFNRPVAIAIDPQIIVSIRILGSSAPPTAVAWLERLDQAGNEIFPLSYADADLSLQAQAGAGSVLTPTSFDQAIDPAVFTDIPPTPSESSTTPTAPADSSVPTTTPTTPGTGAPPTREQLLAWNYTATDIAWPGEGFVATDDLPVFAAAGLNTTILSGSNVSQADSDLTPDTAFALGSDRGTGLVEDDPLSNALRTAAMATTDDSWHAAMSEVGSQLAVVSAERPGRARTLLATLGRGWPPTSARLGQTLDALTAVAWQRSVPLVSALTATAGDDVTFESRAQPAERVATAKRLIERESAVVSFSSALSNPVRVTGEQRLSMLSLLATSWAVQPTGWADAVVASLSESSALLRSVTVSTKGPINVLGSKVDIPITLDNALDQAVTVRIQVIPSNGRLLVGADIESTIEAQSAQSVLVPVTSAVGNGAVTLRVTVFTPSGTVIDTPSLIPINVRADWEGLGALLFAGLVVLFFGFGVWRNIARRRRDKDGSTRAETESDA